MRIFTVFGLLLAMMLAPAGAGERGKPVPLKQLPTELRMFILDALKSQGIKGNGAMTYASDATKNCPSNCNDSSGGGYCFCGTEKDGSCPKDTEKTGPPDNPECKVKNPGKGTGVVSGGGLAQPIKIEG